MFLGWPSVLALKSKHRSRMLIIVQLELVVFLHASLHVEISRTRRLGISLLLLTGATEPLYSSLKMSLKIYYIYFGSPSIIR